MTVDHMWWLEHGAMHLDAPDAYCRCRKGRDADELVRHRGLEAEQRQ